MPKKVLILSFSGERDITSLEIFPVSKASDPARRQKLEHLGENNFDILRNGHEQVVYDGYTLAKPRDM